MKKILIAITMVGGLVCSALLPFNVSAAPNPEPYLVADINVGVGGSSPDSFVGFNGFIFFSADDGVNGIELWKSNGTITMMVKDIYPGTYEQDGEVYPNSSGPFYSINAAGTFYFSADDGTHGRELWKSDGTTAGTVMVKDICTGVDGDGYPNGSNISSFVNFNGTLYFSADDGTHGAELWKSDGTTAGTVMVKDVDPGIGEDESPYSSQPSYLINVDGTLFFTATVREGEQVDYELWKSDGTTAGTVMVSSDAVFLPAGLLNGGGIVYTVASDDTYGAELWKSDGTTAGTVMVKDIYPGIDNYGVDPNGFAYASAVVGNDLFFLGNDGTTGYELWKSDGTTTDTVMVKDIYPGINANYNYVHSFINSGGVLYFIADDGTHGRELWKSDGTTAGTVMVKDIYPGAYGESVPSPTALTSSGNMLFFNANDGTHGAELWQSDGTTAGTVMVKDIYPGADGEEAPNSSYPYGLVEYNGAIYFMAGDGVHGDELWAYDVPDSTPPVFVNLPGLATTINLVDGQTVATNPFIIQVKPSDNYEIERVEFYVDGTLICTSTTPDANGVYACSWNTSLYHSDIRVIAYDDSGNPSLPLDRSVNVNLGGLPNTGLSAWYYLLGLVPVLGIAGLRFKSKR
jgi:ELWxxDGT repeat protein